ncbi:MAG TPA: hypothetical protein PKY88_12310 [Anaerohalosphaeraceae bacterium]|nr:hypothetical protein [Anaerohalosphaeraceae bacterium]
MSEEVRGVQILAELSETIQTRPPLTYWNLTLVPLVGLNGSVSYLLASEALEQGLLTVQEVSTAGQVNTLRVKNKSPHRILLLDGEELVGAKQNRILNTTILLEAQSVQDIPVSCVEQGRWHHCRPDFISGGLSFPKLRASKTRRVTESLCSIGQPLADQGEIWDEVEHALHAFKLHSPTKAMKDVYDRQKDNWEDFTKALAYPEGACGVAASVGGRMLILDVFDKPDTLKKIWPRLTAAYALEALQQKNEPEKSFDEKNARFFLDGLKRCQTHLFKSVGLGEELRFQSDELFGQALWFEQSVIHLALFPNDGREHGQGRMMPPAFRRSRHMH